MRKLLIPVIALIAFATFANATDIPVKFKFDDGAHAYMPRLEVISPTPTRLKVQDPEPAPSPWSVAAYWDLRTKESSLVVLRKIGPLVQPFGLKCTFDVEGFAGASMSGDAVVGVAITVTVPLAKNFDFKFGPATTWQPGQQFKDAGVGLILAGSYRF